VARSGSPRRPASSGGGGGGGAEGEESGDAGGSVWAVADVDHTAILLPASSSSHSDLGVDAPASAGGPAPLSPDALARVRYSPGHAVEALWVFSNFAGGTPLQAMQLLFAPLSPDIAAALVLPDAPDAARALGFLPLFVHYLDGPWSARKCAAWTLCNLAMQRAAVSAVSGAPPTPLHPFLPALLSFPSVVPAFVAMLTCTDARGGPAARA